VATKAHLSALDGTDTARGVQPCLACNDINAEGNFTTLAQGSTSVADCQCRAGYG
jgi:hypothetical protein